MSAPGKAAAPLEGSATGRVEAFAEAILAGSRRHLSRAITWVESTRPDHRHLARALTQRLLPRAGQAYRVGITGVPGVGKSTFVEAFGCHLTAAGHRVAVLAVDPSSRLHRGSILADKTRMGRLACQPNAFIRPSPSGGTLGGVATSTRDTLLLCEAAGYDIVLVETVGVGQSEAMVAEMVDFFLVLLLARAGDELQGMKCGVLELADLVAITKADGDNLEAAERARAAFHVALRALKPPPAAAEMPPAAQVLTCSAREGRGIAEIWAAALDHRLRGERSGALAQRRAAQQLNWMWEIVDHSLNHALRAHPQVSAALGALEGAVLAGKETPASAAAALLDAFGVGGLGDPKGASPPARGGPTLRAMAPGAGEGRVDRGSRGK